MNEPSNKGNQNSTSRKTYHYECTCGWVVDTKEGKAYDLLIRLHKKKCNTSTVVTDMVIKRGFTNGVVKKQTTLDVTERRLK